jgi:WD40 repeat protein
MISEARFVSPDRVILSLVSDELILFNIMNGEEIYRVQVGMSSLSDIQLSEDRKLVAVSDESGVVSIISAKDGRVVRRLSGINVDKLYKLDYKRDTVMVGGRDRRVGIYFLRDGSRKRIDAEFLVFAVALSEDAGLGAFPYNEKNDIRVINTRSGATLAELKGQKSTVSVMLFLGDLLLVGCDDGRLLIWNLKGEKLVE